jgi:hypothetical protein
MRDYVLSVHGNVDYLQLWLKGGRLLQGMWCWRTRRAQRWNVVYVVVN